MHSIFSQFEIWLNWFSWINALGIKKIKRTTPKKYFEYFCQHQGRQSIEILMYVTRIFIDCCLPWDRETLKSDPNDLTMPMLLISVLKCFRVTVSTWVLLCLIFSHSVQRQYGRQEGILLYRASLCVALTSARTGELTPHCQDSKAMADTERWVSG